VHQPLSTFFNREPLYHDSPDPIRHPRQPKHPAPLQFSDLRTCSYLTPALHLTYRVHFGPRRMNIEKHQSKSQPLLDLAPSNSRRSRSLASSLVTRRPRRFRPRSGPEVVPEFPTNPSFPSLQGKTTPFFWVPSPTNSTSKTKPRSRPKKVKSRSPLLAWPRPRPSLPVRPQPVPLPFSFRLSNSCQACCTTRPLCCPAALLPVAAHLHHPRIHTHLTTGSVVSSSIAPRVPGIPAQRQAVLPQGSGPKTQDEASPSAGPSPRKAATAQPTSIHPCLALQVRAGHRNPSSSPLRNLELGTRVRYARVFNPPNVLSVLSFPLCVVV
jgi:hypothetical protein